MDIGATGIEPVTSGSQNQHSTAELRPVVYVVIIADQICLSSPKKKCVMRF
jgi:hypothetical protein